MAFIRDAYSKSSWDDEGIYIGGHYMSKLYKGIKFNVGLSTLDDVRLYQNADGKYTGTDAEAVYEKMQFVSKDNRDCPIHKSALDEKSFEANPNGKLIVLADYHGKPRLYRLDDSGRKSSSSTRRVKIY